MMFKQISVPRKMQPRTVLNKKIKSVYMRKDKGEVLRTTILG